MELKPGYKQTEVGVIPEDWGTICFKDSFDFLTSATYSRAETSKIGHICYVHYGDIHTKWNHFIDFKKQPLPLVSEAQAKNYPRIKDGDLVMADASEDYDGIGKSVEVKNLGNKQAISGLHTFLLRDKKGVFASFFKGYIHSNPIVKKQFDRLATGLKVFGVSRGNLKIIEIPLPTKAEQEAIAGALSDSDELIASLEQLIEKKRMIKQGAMQELLTGKKRLPGFQQNPGYKQTEVGEIPEDWVEKQTGDLISFQGGSQPDKSFFSNTPKKNWIRLIQIRDYKNDKYVTYVPQKLARRFCTQDDIMIGRYGPPVFQILRGIEGAYNVALIKAIVSPELSKTFAYYFLKQEKLFLFIDKLSRRTSGQTGVDLLELRKYPFPLPPTKAEQEAIASVLSDLDAEIDALEEKLEKARKIKAGMMHNLLTGTIRLV